MPPMKRKTTAKERSVSLKRQRTSSLIRRPRTYAGIPRVQLGRGPIPASSFVNLRYVAGFKSPGTVFDQVFNLNGIFDPDQTGTGHQPLGRDQYATFYNRYRVWSCRMKLVFTVDGSVSNIPVVVGYSVNNTTSAYTDMDTALEQVGGFHTLTNNWSKPVTIVRNFYLPSITGVSKADYKDDRFQALMSANPTENICLHIVFGTVLDSAVAANVVNYRVQLDFHTELFDPLVLAQS